MDNETKQMFEMILKKLDNMQASQNTMEVSLGEMKASQDRIEEKLNFVYEHTAKII